MATTAIFTTTTFAKCMLTISCVAVARRFRRSNEPRALHLGDTQGTQRGVAEVGEDVQLVGAGLRADELGLPAARLLHPRFG